VEEVEVLLMLAVVEQGDLDNLFPIQQLEACQFQLKVIQLQLEQEEHEELSLLQIQHKEVAQYFQQ
jgi:hypothetical protein